MKISIEALEGRGDAYQFGLKQADRLKQTVLYNKHVRRRKKSIRRYTTDFRETKAWIEEISPDLWAELEGLSEGLGWRFEDIVHEYAGYQQSWIKSGCSALMGRGVYGRNYDYHPKTYDGRFIMYQPTSGYASVGFAQRIVGRMDGMNEKGLAVGYHFVNRISPEDGFICCSIARLILDSCASVPEAVRLLKELPHRHSFNYSLADSAGRTAVVEASAKGAVELQSDEGACTNHFRAPSKLSENRHMTKESEQRLERLVELKRGSDSANDTFNLLNKTKYGIAKKEYGNWSGTIHTAVYDTVSLNVNVGIGTDAVPVGISFADWLKGSRFIVRKLRGQIDFEDGMEHLGVQLPERSDPHGTAER
ncbi:C45 family autoproteolytic acyltransferase/hydolase [Alkalicoccus luteus]|uniref:Acyl-CoA--6-aminopenicillanic acid acyl-transferase n=1 Tax=Alkalicoccus luteus TaxID=1237094 RepID=A0A969PSV3_9BACI|nr:C45 family peptidase [Alkalicoccus luteus]NJP37308.1 acyl-CoA--6-aminopenicillanic acid acyl-transferase [Alkalicoccus luteus]